MTVNLPSVTVLAGFIGGPAFVADYPLAVVQKLPTDSRGFSVFSAGTPGYLALAGTSNGLMNRSVFVTYDLVTRLTDEQGRNLAARAALADNPLQGVQKLVAGDIALSTNPQYSWLANPGGRIDTEKIFLAALQLQDPSTVQVQGTATTTPDYLPLVLGIGGFAVAGLLLWYFLAAKTEA